MVNSDSKINDVAQSEGSAALVQAQIGQRPKNNKIIWILAISAISMFGFGFALAPLYQLICSVTGLNNIGSAYDGRVSAAEYATQNIVAREVTVQFDSTLSNERDWKFKPSVKSLKVRLGEVTQTNYLVTNALGHEVVAQAVPSVTPWQAGEYLKKIDCFCFDQQILAAGEHKDMPLIFVIDPDLPKDINTVTLSYTLMKVKPEQRVAINSSP